MIRIARITRVRNRRDPDSNLALAVPLDSGLGGAAVLLSPYQGELGAGFDVRVDHAERQAAAFVVAVASEHRKPGDAIPDLHHVVRRRRVIRDGQIEELARQADAWDKAIIRKDRAAIADNMAEDFRQISARGDVAGKAAFLDAITSSKLVINPYGVEDMDIRFYGDVALVSGRTRMTGSYDGKPFGSHYRYVDVYVRKEGKWRVASVQITPVQE